MNTAPFAPGCPWYDWHRALPPNVKWCEAPLCSAVVEPANAWSNLAYVAVALWLLLTSPAGVDLPERRRFGWAALMVGLTSGLYHASNNLITQFIDFLGMYIFIYLLLVRNLVRLALIPAARTTLTYVAAVAGTLALTPLWRMAGLPIQGIVAVLVLCILFTEWRAGRRAKVDRTYFFTSLLLLTLGAMCSAADVSRLWCDPSNHVIQGHAVWHVLTALSLLAASRFYRQFNLVAA